MRAIYLILSVLGTLVLFFVPVKLSIADSTKIDWGQGISQLAKVASDWNAPEYSRPTVVIITLEWRQAHP